VSPVEGHGISSKSSYQISMDTSGDMNDQIRSQRWFIGVIFFVVGSLFSIGFNSLAVIGDLNAAGFWGDTDNALSFDRNQPTLANLGRLRCPIVLSPNEEGTIRAAFRNPHQEEVAILVIGIVSEKDFRSYREVSDTLIIEPRGRHDFRWNISQADSVEGNLILSRVFLMNQEKSTPYPARTAACGVIVLDFFGLKGSTIVIFLTAISLVSLLFGGILLYSYRKPRDYSSPQLFFSLFLFATTCIICLVANLLGWWILAGLILLFDVLLASIIISNLLFGNA